MNKIPYFSLKVVKVKKEKIPLTPDNCSCKVSELCEHCAFLTSYCKGMKKQPKGTWINGENLDKIKFPCFCSWNDNIGMIIYDFWDKPRFTLIKIDKQTNRNHIYAHLKSLKELIETYKVKILKGKIIIFENKEGD